MAEANLDFEERQKFDAIAASWWDPKGPFRPLHELNPARLAYVADRCQLPGRTLLDVGCGGGILAESLAKKGAMVTGIDVAPRVLSVARLHQLESNATVEYLQSTVEEHANKQPEQYEVITCMEMLEHVPDPFSVVQSVARLLKPGGHAFFSTINRNAIAFGAAILGGEYIARLLPQGTHRYDRFIRPSELSAWLRKAGLKPEDIRGLHYDPISGSVKLGGHVKINYLMHATKTGE